MDLICVASAKGLTPGVTYWGQFSWTTTAGPSNNGSLGSAVADENGGVIFQGNPALFDAVATAVGPGELKVWVSATENGPPVDPVTFESAVEVTA